MADMDIVTSVRRLFPEVTAAVEQYQKAKPDREARNLARRLGNEEALYDQFIRQLSLLSPAPSTKNTDEPLHNVESRLGVETAGRLRTDLLQMADFLHDLKADLSNTSRGTAVLAKLRRKTALSWGALPTHPLGKRLDELSTANKRLTAYLLYAQIPLPLARDFWISLDFRLFLQLNGSKQANSIQVTFQRHQACACDEPVHKIPIHSTSQSGNCDSGALPSYKDRDEGPVALKQRSRHISVSAKSLDESGNNSTFMKDAPSLVDVKETGDNKSPHPTPTKPDRDEKKFQLSIKETSLTPEFLNLKQLISRHGTSFDQRRRMELAFRLSSAVLLLWSSPWIANSSRWKDWAVWFDPQNKEPLFNLYFSRKPQSDNGSPDQKSSAGAAFFILSREPVLSLLGLRLIEIAFGRTLADVRQEDVTLLSKEGDQDQDSMDLFTAKRLLALRRIGQTFGQEFEDVVNVCLNQQYRERKGARITELDFEDRSFLERAAVSILLPLYQEARKNSGCTCNATSPDGTKQGVAIKEDPQHDGDWSDGEDEYVVPTISGRLASEPVKMHDKMASDDDAPTNLPHQSGALASMAAEHGGEGVSSGKPPLSKRRPVSLESSGYLRDPNAVEHDSHGSRVESTNSRHQLTSEVSAPAANKELGEKEDPLHPTGASGARLDFQSGFDTSTGSRNVSHSSFEHVTSTQRLYPQSRDGDDDAGSVYSYETVTMTTDSAFAWLSDHTDEPPELPDDHPILAFQDVALRVLIRTYQAWRQHGSWQNAPPGSAYRPESSRKRTRTDTGEDRDDEFGEGESSSMGVPGVSSKKRRTKEGALTFACPFFKKDPFSYKSCSKYVLSRIRDVKQHLGRGHQKPMYCPRCGQTFEDEDVRDEHLIAQGCEARPILKPEGITEPQKKQLSKKPPVNQSQEEQWFKIFDILFPGHMPRPESPYIESGMLGNVLSYHEFCTSRGPGIMANILTANNAVTWNLPFNELDVQAFQYRIFEQGFQELFSQWTGSGGLSAPGPDTVNLATRRMGRTAHLATPGPSRSTADFGDEGSEQQSVTTPSYFTTESSSHASSSMSWDGHTDWIAPPMGNVGGNALDPFDPMMTTADNEEIMRICRDMQNQNMRFG